MRSSTTTPNTNMTMRNRLNKRLLRAAIRPIALFALATAWLLVPGTGKAQTADVNIIHNSPYAEAAMVDIYINDGLALDNVAFRQASGFLALPAGIALKVDITAATATDNSAPVFTKTLTLADGGTYLLVAAGDPLGREGHPAFDLFAKDMARKTSSMAGMTDVIVFHGSPDAPMVDVVALGSPRPIVNNLAFGDFQGYLELPVADYTLNITPAADNGTPVASFSAPLEALDLGGAALTVLASGFLSPEEGQPAFGLYVASGAGGELLALPTGSDVRAQIIHNAADPGAAMVDIYLTGANEFALKLEDVAFRTATPFVTLPSGMLTVKIAPPTSASADEAIFTKMLDLAAGETYVVVAAGSLSPEAAEGTGFDLFAAAGRESAMMEGETDLQIFHGASDAPTVDVTVAGAGLTLADDLSFGDFKRYQSVAAADYVVNVETADNAAVVQAYAAPLATLGLGGAAINVLASGFMSPEAGEDGFGLYVALPAGGALVALPTSTETRAAGESETPEAFLLRGNFPNPFATSTRIAFDVSTATAVGINLYDATGRRVLTLPESYFAAGSAQGVDVDASALAPGTYLYRVTASGGDRQTVTTGSMTIAR